MQLAAPSKPRLSLRDTGCSRDWREKKSGHWLAVCRSHTGRTVSSKVASEQTGDSTPFEQAFANLAHSTLREAAPKLLDYEVGFQLIEKNRDNSKAVGFFGFQVSGQWLYAPVFYLNGNLKGQELLYVKSQRLFVPLSDDWVNYLLGHKPTMLGQEVSRNPSALGIRGPDLQKLIRSPNKIASSAPPLADWFVDFLPDLAELTAADPRSLWKQATESWSMPDVARLMGKQAFVYLRDVICDRYPQVKQGFARFYGEDALNKIAAAIDGDELRRQSLLSYRPLPTRGSILAKQASPYADEPIRVLTRNDILSEGGEIRGTQEERTEALSTGLSVRDKRPDDKVAKVYSETTTFRTFNPDYTNIYDVFMLPGSFEECLVLMSPTGEHGRADQCLVVELSSKKWQIVHASHVLCRARYSPEKWQQWVDALPKAKIEAGDGDTPNVFVHEHGTGTMPFTCTRSYVGGDGTVAYSVCWPGTYQPSNPDNGLNSPMLPLGQQMPDRLRDADDRESARLFRQIKEREGDLDRLVITPNVRSIRAAGDTVYVPEDAKRVAIDDSPARLPFGQPREMIQAFFEGADWMEIKDDTQETHVKGKDYTGKNYADKNAALKHLIVDWNMRRDTAEHVLKLAAESPFRTLKFRVKNSDIDILHKSPPGSPMIEDPPRYTDSFMGQGTPAEYEYERGQLVPDLSASTYPTPARLPDPDTMSTAQQAAGQGQKQLFDASVFQSMLGANRHDTMVGSRLGDIIKGMHAKGCIYFQFLWHGQSFEDRYGKEDLPEIEDGLRNAFDADGKLVLALKRKSVEPSGVDGIQHNLASLND